jgi:uncharacterized protein YcaQ
LIQDIFNFEYTWEVYKPKNKRQYGYYVLPVLYGEKFIARTDLKFEKKSGVLNLNDWWWEAGIKPNNEMLEAIKIALKNFQTYLGSNSLESTSSISI